MLWRLLAALALTVAGISTWAAAAEHRGPVPGGTIEPQYLEPWVLTGPGADERRREALARARFTIAAPGTPSRVWTDSGAIPSCSFIAAPQDGTSAKFECVAAGGVVLKVKYGRNPEIQAEAAATALLARLHYPTDAITIVPRLRCYGCPRYPFLTTRLRAAFGLSLLPHASEGYTDFEWVSAEERYPALAIETASAQGWSWWELDASDWRRRAEVDAIRLLAVFLSHWDNKSENQRLVCLDEPRPPAAAPCAQPLAMIQDLGATFGPPKVNLAQWTAHPIWFDRDRCLVSMRALPFDGASFPDAQISEEGRRLLLQRLRAIPDSEFEEIVRRARFPEYYAGTDDEGDVRAWVAAYRSRVHQIALAQCQ